MEKFVALFDLHYGYEINSSRHKVPLHDEKALNVALDFIADFKPDHLVLGGDMLDCGSLSHHRLGNAGQLEGLRILAEAKELRKKVLTPLEATKASLTYMIGNHEAWLDQLVEKIPSLDGIIQAEHLLGLDKWKVVEQGGFHKLGKLKFVHGDNITGGQHHANAAVTAYEANVRFGHFHTYAVSTKSTPIEANGHTGIAVPCLCRKGHAYGKKAPNKWMQGFLWGYVGGPAGSFNDYVTVIVNGKAMINGKLYEG
jgi:metallophosphoesterase superfamily enzyme